MSKRYKIVKSDLCISGKIYKEGTIVNFIDESLEKYFEPIPDEILKDAEKPVTASAAIIPEAPSIKTDEVTPAALEQIPIPESSINIPKKGRPKKVTETI